MSISTLENSLRCLDHRNPDELPTILDIRAMNTRLIRDNIARGTVRDGRESLPYNDNGELDSFGVTWVYDKATNGAMEKHDAEFILDDISNWRDMLVFPDPDSWDWDAEALLSKKWLNVPDIMYKSTIFTGYFERLISFVGFEDASVALIDEDIKPDAIALLERLTDYYISLVKHMKESFHIDLIEIHDDWGGQNSTFFSEKTLRETILPALTRFVKFAHSLGLFVELHSCGKIGTFVPAMIDAGIDMWMGQDHNDKAALCAQYGNKIVIESEFPRLGPDANSEQIEKTAHEFVDQFIVKGRVPMMSVYGYAYNNPSELEQRIRQLAAEKLATFKD